MLYYDNDSTSVHGFKKCWSS